MAIDAVRLGGSLTTSDVFGRGNGLQMGWVGARPIAAEMIDLLVGRDRANMVLVREAVNIDFSSCVAPEYAITLGIRFTLPKPASIGCNLYFPQ